MTSESGDSQCAAVHIPQVLLGVQKPRFASESTLDTARAGPAAGTPDTAQAAESARMANTNIFVRFISLTFVRFISVLFGLPCEAFTSLGNVLRIPAVCTVTKMTEY